MWVLCTCWHLSVSKADGVLRCRFLKPRSVFGDGYSEERRNVWRWVSPSAVSRLPCNLPGHSGGSFRRCETATRLSPRDDDSESLVGSSPSLFRLLATTSTFANRLSSCVPPIALITTRNQQRTTARPASAAAPSTSFELSARFAMRRGRPLERERPSFLPCCVPTFILAKFSLCGASNRRTRDDAVLAGDEADANGSSSASSLSLVRLTVPRDILPCCFAC